MNQENNEIEILILRSLLRTVKEGDRWNMFLYGLVFFITWVRCSGAAGDKKKSCSRCISASLFNYTKMIHRLLLAWLLPIERLRGVLFYSCVFFSLFIWPNDVAWLVFFIGNVQQSEREVNEEERLWREVPSTG